MIYSSVPCAELNGSRKISADYRGQSQSSVTLRCDWAVANDLMADILDNRRRDPMFIGLFARSVEIAPEGGESGGYIQEDQGLIPKFAHVTVQYGTLTPEEQEEQDREDDEQDANAEIATWTTEAWSEAMALDHNAFHWGETFETVGAAPLKPEESPVKIFRGMTFVANWKRVEVIPPEIFTLIDKVNDDTVTLARFDLTCAAETLLYKPPVITSTLRRDGARVNDINGIKLLYRPTGWNKFWRAATQTWEIMYSYNPNVLLPDEPYKNFEPADFSPITG